MRDTEEYQNAPAKDVKRPLPPGCKVCHGHPWVSGEINGHECAMRCDCERGKYLRARDKERRAA